MRIPTPLGRWFRRDLGADSERTWAAFRSTWAPVPEHLGGVPEHLGTGSGALGQGRLKALTGEQPGALMTPASQVGSVAGRSRGAPVGAEARGWS